MAAKKKPGIESSKKNIYICYICGKEIHGEHVKIKTKRGDGLHIHFECVPRGRQDGRD